jgi:PAS domain S-box-containing protein
LRLVADVIANALDRKRSEEALHDSEEKLRLMFESVSEGVFVTDLQGNITEVNLRGLELSGAQSKDDLMGRNALEFIDPVERKKLVKAFQRTLEGESRPQEYTLQKLNGTSCIAETNGAVLKDASRKPVGFISAVRDITERKWVEEELARYRYQLEEIVEERTYQLTDANERLKEEIVERKKTEEELRQSKEFNDKLIASMHDGVTVMNREGVRMVVNDALCEMSGFSSEELLSQYPGPFWPPEEYEEIVRNLYRTYTGEISEFEANFMRKNGERFPALVSQSFINDDRGNPINYVSTIKDISERKQMEQALRESEEHFRSIAEALPIPVAIAREKDGVITYVNQHFGSIMGQSVEEILGRRIIEFYADIAERNRILNDLKKGKYIHNREVCARRSNGTSFWVIASIEPLVFEGEKCLMGVFYDISERKQMEDMLREKGEYFRSLIENSLDVIAIMNPDGSVRYQSPYAGRILGYSLEDRQIAENPFEFLHQKDRQGAQEMFAELVQNPGSVRRAEIRARHRDGSWHSFEVVAKSLVEDPVVGGIVAHFYDTTERKREAEKLKRYYGREKKLRRQLEEEMQKRIEFTRALAHELKTPLTPVIMSSQILTTELKRDEVLLRVAENINRGACNLNSRIDELLDLARGEVGMLQIRPQRMDLVELLREVIEEIAPVPLSRGQFLKAELPHAEPPVLPPIRADRGRVKQVVMNLLNNAFKYTPDGGEIVLNVRQDESTVIVEVKDTGPGLPYKEQKRIFEPYHRIDSDRGELGGLGLGLALCRRLVELHGGWIGVESQPGSGSTFSFSLPIQGPVKQK